jgi:hypothetical protein
LYPDNFDFFTTQDVYEPVEVRTSLAALSNLTIRRLGTEVERESLPWNGLTIKADKAAKQIILSRTAPLTVGKASFDVTGTSNTGEKLRDTLKVTIVAPDSPTPPVTATYRLGLSPSSLHPIVTKDFDKTVEVYVTSSTAKSLTLESVTIDGQPTASWYGLTLFVDANKNISVFGIPTTEGTKTFRIAGTATTGEAITSANLTITVHPQEEEGRTRGRFIDLDFGKEIKVERGKSTAIKLTTLSYVTVDSVTEVNPDGKWEWIQGATAEGVTEFYVSVFPTVTGLYTLRVNYSLGGTAYYENVNYRSVRTDEEGLGSGGCALGAGSMMGLALAALYLSLRRKKI